MSIRRVTIDHELVYVCDECHCYISGREHQAVCPQRVTELAVAPQWYDQTEEKTDESSEPHWTTQPLTIALTTRNGQTFVLDGVENDTRVSLSGLDAVDKAALTVLLQQALREMSPARASGGFVAGPTTVTVNQP